ncbi:MAG: HipA domain-containing protein [bacterium]|nr:HipA domain-containing protein [bacterium]
MRLDVLIDGHVAGELDLTDHDSPSFRYTEEYLRRTAPTPLSVRIPVTGETVDDPWLAGWLRGLLPDNSRVLRSWCEDNGVDESYPLRLLGTPVGVDCAGAVQFCPPATTESLIAAQGALDPLTDDEAHDWLRRLRANPAYRPRRWVADVGWSLSGMQPKVAWRRLGDKWAVARGREATSHILKVTRIDYAHEALIEHLTMRTAARLGIPAAATSIIEWDDVEAIAVRRYDRAGTTPTAPLVRLHQEDLCQAAGFAPDRKYQHLGGPDLAACAALIRDPVNPSADGDIQRFRDMLLYHWLIVNPDAHAKNYSLLLRGRERLLAPLYDSSTWLPYRYGDKVETLPLAMFPGADRHLEALDTPEALAALAAAVGVSASETAERAEDLAARLSAAIEATINEAPDHHQNVPEVEVFGTELPERAQHCAAIAIETRRMTPK